MLTLWKNKVITRQHIPPYACTIYEQPISKLAWELNSDKNRQGCGREGFRDLERKSGIHPELSWIKISISKDFYNSRNWGRYNLAALLSIIL